MNIDEAVTRRLTRGIRFRVSKMLFALMALGASLGLAQAPTGDDVPGQHAGTASTDRPSLDFKLYRGFLIVVSGSVGGLKNLHFLLDTGVTRSIADRRLVEKLGANQRPGTLDVTGETIGAGQAVLTDLQIGSITAKSVPVFAVDLSFLEQALGSHIDMLIGLDVLGQSSFSIDYQAKRILFGEAPPLPLMVPMQSGPPLVSVVAWVDGHPLHLVVTTGFSALVLTKPNGNTSIQDVKTQRLGLAVNFAGGRFAFTRISVQSVRLGEMELGRQPAVIVAGRHVFDGSLPIPGRFKEVAFDFEHHLLGLRR